MRFEVSYLPFENSRILSSYNHPSKQIHQYIYIMKSFTLRSGNAMPGIGLGTWKSSPGVVGEAVRAALELGYRHVDCAAAYGNEKEVGEAIRGAMDAGILERGDLFVTSKLWNTMHRPDDVKLALTKTLSDWNTSTCT